MRNVFSALGAFALLLLSGLFCLLPRAWSHWLGRRIGGLAYFLSKRSRETALENLKLRLQVEGPRARWIANKSMGQAGAAVADLLRAPRVTRRLVERDFEVPPETRALIEELRGKPAVMAGCHLGNWEFLSLCRPLVTGLSSLTIVRPPSSRYAARVLAWLRRATGQQVVHRTGAILRAHAHLRDGGSVAMVFDVTVPPQVGAVAVDFLGVPTYTTIAPAYLAARTGAPLLFCFARPIGGARYRLVLKRIDVPRAESPRETALELTKRLSAELEAEIRERPETWAWWLKRWNIRPEGAPGAWPSYATGEQHFFPDGSVRRDLDA